jgi:hypothetical protein
MWTSSTSRFGNLRYSRLGSLRYSFAPPQNFTRRYAALSGFTALSASEIPNLKSEIYPKRSSRSFAKRS